MMNRKRRAAALTLAFAAFAAGARAERFTATLASLEGGGTQPVVVHVDRYTSDAERSRLAGVLADKGSDGLRDALWDLEAGFIRVGGSLGYPIAVARQRPAGSGRIVRLMMDRPISFREAVRGERSLDYPFSYIELKLDKEGRGEGEMYAAAKVSLKGDNVDIESYSVPSLKLLAVRALPDGE